MVAQGREWRGWTTVDTQAAADELGVERDQVIEALKELQVAGDVRLKPSGVRQRFRIVEPPDNIGEVVARMQSLFLRREERDVGRLAQVVRLAEEDGCIVRRLLSYFGEGSDEDCGVCSRCTGDLIGKIELPRSEDRETTNEEVEAVHELIAEGHGSLRSPRQLARFLCGISSPAASRARLNSHDSFGLLEDVEFQEVLALAESINDRRR